MQAELERKIDTKQIQGNYALLTDLPVSMSELENDAEYVNQSEMESSILEAVPEQTGKSGMFLKTNGENTEWVSMLNFSLFDVVQKDHILSFEESKGLALLGSYVYKTAQSNGYGYADFYNKVVAEYNESVSEAISLGGSDITIYTHSNGHRFYNIADKSIVDAFYNSTGIAWYYGVDTENERICLPRNNFINYVKEGNAAVIGNGLTLGVTTGSNNYGLTTIVSGNGLGAVVALDSSYGIAAGSEAPSGTRLYSTTIGLTTDPTKSGLEADLVSNNPMQYWYMVVGNVEYDAVGITSSEVAFLESQLNNKMNLDLSNCTKPYILETYTNGTSGYRLWSDKFFESWGKVSTASAAVTAITLVKKMANTNYLILLTPLFTGDSSTAMAVVKSSISVQGFSVDNISTAYGFQWKVEGYIE